jgi:hypothetical protein
MSSGLRYLVALGVAFHGFTYIPFGFLVPATLKGWKGSRLLGRVLTDGRIRSLIVALNVAAGVAIVLCAIAIVFAPAAPGWWRVPAIAGALLGIAGFAVFLDGQAKLVVQEGAIGAGISLTLLAVAVALPGIFG